MRALVLPLSLALSFSVLPAKQTGSQSSAQSNPQTSTHASAHSSPQATRFLKVDVLDKAGKHGRSEHEGPREVHIRVPLKLATGLLESIADQEIHIGGSVCVDGGTKKVDQVQKLKLDQIVKLLETCKAGDMLLQVDTNDGTHVKISVE